CDGRYVYSVENQKLVEGEYNLYGRSGRTGDNNSNLLMAHQVANGKEVWSLGSAGTPYARTVFLGPPLVQGEGLYCLMEKDEELRLAAFRNRLNEDGIIEPVELWSQPLSVSNDHEESFGDPLRRISGLTPTYCNGMLICPTGRGRIIAYDLAHRIFSWRYEYQDAPLHSRNTIGSLNTLRQNHGIGPEDESRWIDPTPVAAGSRLFITPTDSNSLYCLDAMQGKLLWSVPREDDLYLACVHHNAAVLVGREKIHALDVNNGEELWAIPISRPSGRGYLAGNRYFVPLSTAAIACVDVAQGELLATVPSDYARVPGNLVAAGGNVIALSADRLFCYETALPSDPETSTKLYEMQGKQKMFEGHLTEAIERLMQAQELEPTSARSTLLTELMLDALRRDFSGNAHLIEPLSEFTRSATEKALLEELLAEGFQKLGKHRESFALFLKIAQLPKKEIQRKNHRIRSDLWARAHLEELYGAGSPDDRAAFDKLLDETVASVQDPVGSSDLLQLIEELPGRETLLLERIERIDPYTETLAFEQALIRLQHSSSPELRREGLAKHFKWLLKLDRIEQAVVLRERLLAEAADLICLDGQTGAELVHWAEENQKFSDSLKRLNFKWPAGPPRVVPFPPDNSAIVASSNFFTPIEGDPGLFRGWRFDYISNNPRRLMGFDSFGRQQLEVPVAYLNRNQYQLNHDRKIHLHGHLAVLEFFDHFFVFDLFQNGELAFRHGPHQLAQPLAGVETSSTRGGKTQTAIAPNGQTEIEVVDLFNQPFGDIGVVTEEAIVHQSGRWLIAIDSLSGELRWQRHLASRGQRLFGDRNVVCTLLPDSQTVSQYRTLDGSLIGEYDLGPIDRILDTHEGRLLVQTNLEGQTRIVCHDVPARSILWQTECDADSLFQTIANTELAILERSGRFRVLSLEDGRALAHMQIEPPKQTPAVGAENPKDAVSPPEWLAFWIQPFTEGWLVITQESIAEKNPTVRVSQLTDSVAVHGEVTFLGRDGKVRWNKRIEQQGFSIAHPPTTPVIVLCVKQLPIPGQFVRLPQNALVQLIDLASGENIGGPTDNYQYHGFQIVVSPSELRTEILTSKSLHAVIYGPETGSQNQTPPSPDPNPQ
ncbi:MAG TPA: PQQ-binding-like beta-propeller repeat protein, partial [Planctomycetaceae bacterium]|nr:PQQ-binding-like beta-propeller repeat protein [Planctomycetaceae bacterium]